MWPFKKKIKHEPKLVTSITATIVWNGTDKEDEIIYYLFEDRDGSRIVESKSTNRYGHIYNKEQANELAVTHPMYLKNIYPWLKGKNRKDVPSYRDVANEENAEIVKALYKKILSNG